MNDEKLVELIARIDTKTVEGSLYWEKTASEEEFQANLSRFIIRIRRDSFDGNVDYTITLVDKNGVELESITAANLQRMLPKPYIFLTESAHVIMGRTFINARRKALNVEQAIDSVLSELK